MSYKRKIDIEVSLYSHSDTTTREVIAGVQNMIDNFTFLDPQKKEIDANVYVKLEQDDYLKEII